jgi:hypothetical protein
MAFGTAAKSIVQSMFPETAGLRQTFGGMEVDTPDEGMLSRLKDPELIVGTKGISMAQNFQDPVAVKQERKNMALAQDMFNRGEVNEDILARTGFFMDEDGELKKEIDDLGSTWKIEPDEVKTNTPYLLKDVFDHPTLFNYYPNFEDIPIEFYRGKGSEKGEFSKTGKIRINKNSPDFVDGPQYVMSTMLHEIQHGIQKLERFTQGGDWQKFLRKPLEFATQEEKEQAFKKYLSLGGEAESRNVELRYLFRFLNPEKTPPSWLQTLATDPMSKKYGITKENLTDNRGSTIDLRSDADYEDVFYSEPERTI